MPAGLIHRLLLRRPHYLSLLRNRTRQTEMQLVPWWTKWVKRGKNKSERGRAHQWWATVGEWARTRGTEERQAERQTKLGHVTWLGLTAGRIKYPTACGHLHNKCSFHFINYFSSTGTEDRQSEREATLHSSWQARLFSEHKKGALKTWATRSHRDGKQSESLR